MAMSKIYWFSVFLGIVFITTPSESANLLNRCSPQLPRTRYLKASDWGKCYEFHLEERTWRSANYICSTKGGHLVTIKEERIQKFLLAALYEFSWPRNGIWIGATDKENEMDWLWVTGERVKDGYSRWASGQPSCGFFCFEDCAVMRWKESGRWHDYRCNWLEDYSFICEYDMLPEPTTTTVQTTTTTSTMTYPTTITTAKTASSLPESVTSPEDVPTNATSFPMVPSSKDLESEYLLHGHRWNENNADEGEKNDTDVLLPPAVMLDGTNGARAEQVQESVSSSQAGLGSGSVAFIVIAILVILSAGLCFVLVVMRRSRRKLIREDNKGISYENPYYESSTTDKGSGGSQSDDAETLDETDDDDTVVCGDCGGAAGFTASAFSKKQTELKQQLPSHHSRPRLIMNDYNTPPTLRNNAIKSLKSDHNHAENKLTSNGDNQGHALHMPKDTSVYYDELQSTYANSQLNYDVPRASSQPWYKNDDLNSNDMPPDAEWMYYNTYNENIYESVDNLTALEEQQGLSQRDETDARNFREEYENRYVPFQLDGPKMAASE